MSIPQPGGRPVDPRPGDRAAILRRDTRKSVLSEGTFGGQQGFSLWVQLDPGVSSCVEPGQEVIVACGPVGERVALLARVRDVREGRAALVRQSPWRPVDTRSFPRFATSMPAALLSGGESFSATVLDISLGGMAIEVREPLHAEAIEVQLAGDGESLRLPCLVVSRSQPPGANVLHVEFGILSPEAASRLNLLVAKAGDRQQREPLAS
jgi:PilZ domain